MPVLQRPAGQAVSGRTPRPSDESTLLAVEDLSVHYRAQGPRRRTVHAVDGVSFTIPQGETLGLVGESGSGKSTIGRAILGMTKATSGQVLYNGEDITAAGRRRRRELSAEIRVVFQDPYSSLNPARTVGQTLAESVRSQGLPKDEVSRLIQEALVRVGLPPEAAARYPSRFSGGQRQRIAIARALITNPQLLICDEAVSALDLSVQAQVLNLLTDLQAELGLTQLFIGHDLTVVRHVSDAVAVLFRGRIVEYGPADAVYLHPRHPYARALLDAAPVPDPIAQEQRRGAREAVRPNSGIDGGSDRGCPYARRCPHVTDRCIELAPVLEKTDAGTFAACHHWGSLPQRVDDLAKESMRPESHRRDA